VAAAVQEDADAIGVSILSGAHMSVFPRLIAEMKRQSIWDDVVLIGGGLVPDAEADELKRMGVHEIVGQDATPEQVVGAVRDAVATKRGVA
jgi:methylmalonyl-CoA mutase C-terminal domain/subunit